MAVHFVDVADTCRRGGIHERGMKGMNNNESQLPNVTALDNDNIIAMADQAERRIAAINRIKQVSLQVTNSHDWTDQGGKPYCQVSGAEKIARLFGISWRIDEPQLIIEESGHFEYTYKGYFSMGNVDIEAIGVRSSKDPFFTGKKDDPKPPTEIDRGDVKKAAYTNCIGNGITRLLGIRNLTWDDLATAGIKKEDVHKIEYGKAEMSGEAKDQRKAIGEMILEMVKGDKEAAAVELKNYTSFVGRDGKEVIGKSKLDGLSEKMIPVTYGKVKKYYDEWKKGTTTGNGNASNT